jgi:sugar phosphate isomerase/epimerase
VQGLRLNARTEIGAADLTDTGLRQLRLFVEEHQLRVAGLYCPSRHSVADPQGLDRRLQMIRSAIERVRRLGSTEVLIRAGRIPDPTATAPQMAQGQPDDSDVDSLRNPFSFAPPPKLTQPSEADQFELLTQVLSDLAAAANHHGASLQVIISDYDTARITTLLSRITTGPLQLVFDPAVCVMAGRQPVSIFRSLYQSIGYVRLRDAQKDVDGGGVEVPCGDGAVDWQELLAVLAEAVQPAWMCIERTGGDQRAADVATAVRRLQSLLP